MIKSENLNPDVSFRKWQCYQYCYICENYEVPINEKLSFKKIENEFLQTNSKQKAFFAQYITAFDVEEHTEWWFTIKDDEYDLSKLKSKRRYEITKARKFCYAKRINAKDYTSELYECYKKSFSVYPEKYRPQNISFENFLSFVEDWDDSRKFRLYAVFNLETKLLIGFLLVEIKGKFIKLVIQKTIPEYEHYNSNALLVDCFLNEWNEKLKERSVIITNGSRSIKHETNFNAYLEKYFGFRKAYAKLRVVYRFPFGIIVKLLIPFRKILKNTSNSFLYNIYCVLKMDSFSK